MYITVMVAVLSSLIGLHGPAEQAQPGTMPQVVCIGTACGGGGGSGNPCTGSEYAYRVKPNGNPITSFDVSVEDGDLSHYSSFCAPGGWNPSIVAIQRPHDLSSTPHGQVTGSNSDCQYVLRFHSSTPRSTTFEVGYTYDHPDDGFHDVTWRTSNATESFWTFPVGMNKGPVHSPVPRRNVLVIVLDDVGNDQLDLFEGNQTNTYAPTPQLDALAAAGIKFTSFYSNPLCSITRACLQTGRHPFRTGMGWNAGTFGLADQEVLLAELLTTGFTSSADSYRSGAFGKWHLDYIYDLQDPPQYHPVENGYLRFYGTVANVSLLNGNHFNWIKFEHDAPGPPSQPITVTTWSADVVRADAVSWINQQTGPFFAYVAFNPPHVRQQVPPTYTQDARILLSQGTIDDLNGALPGALPNGPDEHKLFYRAALEAVDSEIGYLLQDISPVKRTNTMVFVVGDNGSQSAVINPPHDANHGKGSVYQHGVNVPMIVSGPMVPPGPHVCDRPVGAVDLWSTIAEIAGASPTVAFDNLNLQPHPVIDSVSFLPLIQDPSGPATSPWAFSQLFIPLGPYTTVSNLTTHNRSITDGRYKYVHRVEVGPPIVDTYEFYDVIAYPEEDIDLLLQPGFDQDPRYPTYLELRNELELLSEF